MGRLPDSLGLKECLITLKADVNPLILTGFPSKATLLPHMVVVRGLARQIWGPPDLRPVRFGKSDMTENTMTRADLSEAVYQEVGLSRNESTQLLEAVLEEISEALTREEVVKISSFGSFSVRQKSQRIGRNPKTGEEVPILPRRVLVFRPSQVLKARINNEDMPADMED